eukprot:Hpha_TRINITY_DN16143_c5_g3::TRINITY_DN16143_c5_g3_i1::g.6930::m.6930
MEASTASDTPGGPIAGPTIESPHNATHNTAITTGSGSPAGAEAGEKGKSRPSLVPGISTGDPSKQSSFRTLSRPLNSPMGPSGNVSQTRAQWLAAKEQELQQREEKIAEAEAQVLELNTLRDDADRHAAELTLMEAALRDKERIHGTLEERSQRILDREQELDKWEGELEKRSGQCVVREAEVERASEERMRQYENLVKPLAQRERMCLEQEEDLHRRREETAAFCKKEEDRQIALRDITTKRELEVRDMRRGIYEQRSRLERRENEVEALKEEVSEYLRMQKKKSDELFERSRQLEWKEHDSEAKVKLQAQQAQRNQLRAEELVRQAEDQKLHEARLAEQQAAADELRADLATKRRRLLAADEEVQKLERQARARDEEAEQVIEDAEQRKKEADEAAERIEERGKEMKEREEAIAKREQELSKEEKKASEMRKKLEAGQRELLEWMKQTEWREKQLDALEKAAGKSRGAKTAPFLADPVEQRTANRAVFPADSTPSALVSLQLHEMKERYLGTTTRRVDKDKDKDKPKGQVEEPRVPLFEAAVSDALEVEEIERMVKKAAHASAKYLSKLRVLHDHQSSLPISPAEAVNRTDLTDTEKAVLDAFTLDEQTMVREFLNHERRTRKEMDFLATMHAAPLLQRLNSATDAEVIREMEVWYKKVRGTVRSRYKQVLKERASGLMQCEELFRKKESRERDLFETLTVRGDSGALAAEFSVVTSREQNSIHKKTPASRIRALVGSHHQRGVPPRPVRREQSPPRTARSHGRPARLVPLQMALRQAGVKASNGGAGQMYLRAYFEHDEEESLLDPTRPQPLEASKKHRRSTTRARAAKAGKEAPDLPPTPEQEPDADNSSEHATREGSEAPGGDGGEDPPSRPGSAALVNRKRVSSAGSARPPSASSAATPEVPPPGGAGSRPGSGRPPPAPKPGGGEARTDSGAGSDDDSRSYSSGDD